MDLSRWRSQLLKGTTPLLVLAVLSDGELYGYEIARCIRERSAGALAPGEGTIYPTLHRLEHEGLVAAEWREGDAGPRRRYYSLTKSGLAALASHQEQWLTFSRSVALVGAKGGSGG